MPLLLSSYIRFKELMLRILEHQSHLLPESFHRVTLFINIFTVKIQFSAGSTDQTVQMLDQRRFPGSGMSDDADKFALPDIQIDILHGLLFVGSSRTVDIIQPAKA